MDLETRLLLPQLRGGVYRFHSPFTIHAVTNKEGVDMIRRILAGAMVVATMLLSGCGYNSMQAGDQQVKAAWAEVVNQYQRRTDLIPNLVNTVKGFAAQEQQVLLGVTEARAKA